MLLPNIDVLRRSSPKRDVYEKTVYAHFTLDLRIPDYGPTGDAVKTQAGWNFVTFYLSEYRASRSAVSFDYFLTPMGSSEETGFEVSLSDEVYSFWENLRPLDEKQEIARWMGAQLADDWQLYHEDVVDHIKSTYGLHTEHLSSTENGGSGIHKDIRDIFKEPFTVHKVNWKGSKDYSERKWELCIPGTPLSGWDLDD